MVTRVICIIVILVCVCKLVIISKTKTNNDRHLTNEHHFAHFSNINSSNYFLYPSFLFKTSPIRFQLHPGDSIFIPAKWWHWITSEKAIAVNVWSKERQTIATKPFIIKSRIHESDKILDIVHKYKDKATIWNSNSDDVFESELTKSGGDNKCIMTLSGYRRNSSNAKLNQVILNEVEQYIKKPVLFNGSKVEKNMWITLGKHDTGLHYDDQDGILTVLEGNKNVILYPPSDSKYLSPIPVIPEWAKTKPLQVEYNVNTFIKDLDPKKSFPSSRILYESVISLDNRHVLKYIKDIVNIIGTNKTVWGMKKHGDTFRWDEMRQHFKGVIDIITSQPHNSFIDQQSMNQYFNDKLLSRCCVLDRYTQLFAADHLSDNFKCIMHFCGNIHNGEWKVDVMKNFLSRYNITLD